MSHATVSLEWIGTTLRQMQADRVEDRLARELLQAQIARLETKVVTREDLADVLRLFSRELSQRDERFDRIDTQLAAIAAKLDKPTT